MVPVDLTFYFREREPKLCSKFIWPQQCLLLFPGSFIISPEVVPGRIGLLVTIFLVLVNIFNRVQSNAPVSKSLNAVDLYLIVCIGHVFLALSEYAIVLFLAKHNRGIKTETRNNMKRDSTRFGISLKQESVGQQNTKLDKMSLIVFPFCFIVFNIAYIRSYM